MKLLSFIEYSVLLSYLRGAVDSMIGNKRVLKFTKFPFHVCFIDVDPESKILEILCSEISSCSPSVLFGNLSIRT